MRPLEKFPELAKALDAATADAARAVIDGAVAASALDRAALDFARGALALREGDLAGATRALGASSDAFAREGEREAAELARVEALLAELRSTPKEALRIRDAYRALADAAASLRVKTGALRGLGTAHRVAGDAIAAQRAFLDALAGSEDLLDERAMTLNSLGTLYVLLGAHGAARSLLEHAAELHHQLGNVVGVAIAHGQLGAAFLALGDRDRARKHLQLQEWHAGKIGDAFGRSRALVYLADIALDLGRPDDAIEIADTALAVATAAKLSTWIAYAKRARGRAALLRGEGDADLLDARDRFTALGLRLGLALTSLDLARTAGASAPVLESAWELGSLALAPRVAELLRDRDAGELAIAATAAAAPHLVVAHEIDLVYRAPEALTTIAARRIAAQRNLGRLGALTLADPGLVVAAIGAPHAGSIHAISFPDEAARAAAIVESAGFVAWVWRIADAASIPQDLARVLPSLGEGVRAEIALAPNARVLAPPFLGGVGATTEGLALGPLIAALESFPPKTVRVATDVLLPPDAAATFAAAGFTLTRA